jgi:hypothetical protein
MTSPCKAEASQKDLEEELHWNKSTPIAFSCTAATSPIVKETSIKEEKCVKLMLKEFLIALQNTLRLKRSQTIQRVLFINSCRLMIWDREISLTHQM